MWDGSYVWPINPRLWLTSQVHSEHGWMWVSWIQTNPQLTIFKLTRLSRVTSSVPSCFLANLVRATHSVFADLRVGNNVIILLISELSYFPSLVLSMRFMLFPINRLVRFSAPLPCATASASASETLFGTLAIRVFSLPFQESRLTGVRPNSGLLPIWPHQGREQLTFVVQATQRGLSEAGSISKP